MTEQYPGILYHYTTMNSLWNILNNLTNKGDVANPEYRLKLWFTCTSYMNDPMEEFFFKKSLWLAFLNYQQQEGLVDKSHHLQLAFMGLEVKRGDSFALSLSEHPDELSMWRAYGHNGQGMAIGFDTDKLARSIGGFSHCRFLKMDYKTETECSDAFDPVHLQQAHDAIRLKDHGGISIGLDIYEILYDKHQNIKHSSYREEQEWRIVFNHDLELQKQFRERNGLIIPYIEVELPLDVIKHFVIGPCADQDLSKRSLDTMLFHKARGFTKEENRILLSQVPYVLR